MIKLTQQEMAAVRRLHASEDFVLFKAFLERSLRESDEHNRGFVEEWQLRRGQGSSLTLIAILDNIREATKSPGKSA